MMNEPMKMLIFLVALCFLLFCSAKHLCFTLRTKAKQLQDCKAIKEKIKLLTDKCISALDYCTLGECRPAGKESAW